MNCEAMRDGYQCTLLAGHEHNEIDHIATLRWFADSDRAECGCWTCVDAWAEEQTVIVRWPSDPEDATFKNPPDVRTRKAERLP